MSFSQITIFDNSCKLLTLQATTFDQVFWLATYDRFDRICITWRVLNIHIIRNVFHKIFNINTCLILMKLNAQKQHNHKQKFKEHTATVHRSFTVDTALSKCFAAVGSIEGVVGSKNQVPLPSRGFPVKYSVSK